MKSIVAAGFAAFMMTTVGAAAATCGAVSGATMCEEGSTNNDKFNVGPDKDELQVNLDSIFDMDTWSVVSKDDKPNGKYSVGSDYMHYMVVLKGAKAYNYVAYKVAADTEGTYSLFAFGGKETSHATIYGKGDGGGTSEVPLPAAGFLLLAGMGGLAMLRRKQAR